VVLTEAGRQLVERGRTLEREFTALLGAVRDAGATPSGLVRMLLPVGLPTAALAPLVAMSRSTWPDMQIATRFADAPLAAPLGDVDLVLWFGDGAPGGAWTCRAVAPTPLRLLASDAYLARHGAPRSLAALADHELFVWTPDGGAPTVTTRRGERHAVRAALSSANVDLLHDCARRGLGLAWVPDGGLSSPGAATTPVLPDELGAPCELWLAAPEALARTPRVSAYLDRIDAMRALALRG
jgi:DNA-binding transcriptional LysR family regulator